MESPVKLGKNESRTHSAQWLAHFETTFAFSVTQKVPKLPPPPLTEDKNDSVSGEVMVTLVSHHLSSLLLLSRALSWRKCVKCLAGLCVLSEAGTVGTAASHVQMCMIWQLVQPQNMYSLRPDKGEEKVFFLFFFSSLQPEVFKKHLRPGRRLTEDLKAVSLAISLSELMGSN